MKKQHATTYQLAPTMVIRASALWRHVNRQRSVAAGVLCMLCAVALPASAMSVSMKRSMIEQQAAQFVSNQLTDRSNESADIVVTTNPIDQRINIPDCPSFFRYDTNPELLESPTLSVKVSCDEIQWYTFVVLKVEHLQDVVVVKQSMEPNTLLTRSNLRITQVDKHRIRGTVYDSIEAIEGARVKRRLRPGQVISQNMVCYVCKGDRVTIAARSPGIQLKTYGIAQQDGTLGESISVQNMTSKKAIFARVADTETVVIDI